MVQSKRNENNVNNIPTAIKAFIYRYNVLVDGRHVKCNILGWRNALYQARIRAENLFEHPKKVEILNVWTGEIISLEEAEKMARMPKPQRQSIVTK